MMTSFFTSVQNIKGPRGWYLLFGVALVFFFFIYAHLAMRAPRGFFNSPDEMVNYYFTSQFAQSRTLWHTEPLNIVAEDRVHPRATISSGGLVVPVSFVGLPVLYGAVARALGISLIPFITPFVAVIASLLWYVLTRRMFGEQRARIASLALLAHPAWWYYAARGMFHNVFFVALLVCAGYFAFTSIARRGAVRSSYLLWLLGSALFGAALFVRTVEAVWLVPLLGFVLFVYRRHIGATRMCITAGTLFVCAIFIISLNRLLYGTLLPGYGFLPQLPYATVPEVPSVARVVRAFFPSGIHMARAAQNVVTHFFGIAWWVTLPAIVGAVLMLRARTNQLRNRVYLVVTGAVALILFLWYGSWELNDSTSGRMVSIANSYTRYWLPATVLATPLFASSVEYCSALIPRRMRAWGAAACVIIVMSLSAWRVNSGPDGLRAVVARLQYNQKTAARVAALVAPEAVIVTDRHDKLFFPRWRVMFPLRNEGTIRSVRLLRDHVPLYYYGTSARHAAVRGFLLAPDIRLDPIAQFDGETLYQFVFL